MNRRGGECLCMLRICFIVVHAFAGWHLCRCNIWNYFNWKYAIFELEHLFHLISKPASEAVLSDWGRLQECAQAQWSFPLSCDATDATVSFQITMVC